MPASASSPFASNAFSVVIAPSGPADLLTLRTGFSEVILPETIIPAGHDQKGHAFTSLVLRRAVSVDRFLSSWAENPVERDLAIVLITGNQPSAAWRVTAAAPERLIYSPLNAAESGVMLETLELRVRDFRRLDIASSRTSLEDVATELFQNYGVHQQ